VEVILDPGAQQSLAIDDHSSISVWLGLGALASDPGPGTADVATGPAAGKDDPVVVFLGTIALVCWDCKPAMPAARSCRKPATQV